MRTRGLLACCILLLVGMTTIVPAHVQAAHEIGPRVVGSGKDVHLSRALVTSTPHPLRVVEAGFDLVRIPPSLDPPWKIEDKIGGSSSDDESPSITMTGNGTFVAMYQVRNGTQYDIAVAISRRGGPWSGLVFQNATLDTRNVSVTALDDGRVWALAEEWSNRSNLILFESDDDGVTWTMGILMLQQGSGVTYSDLANPCISSTSNRTLGDSILGSYDLQVNTSSTRTLGVLFSDDGGKSLWHTHFLPQTSDLRNPRCALTRSTSLGVVRSYITAEFTNGTNTDGVLIHTNFTSPTWQTRQYSPPVVSYEADPIILAEGSSLLWVMRTGPSTNGNIIAFRSTDDAATFTSPVTVAGTGTTEQHPSASMRGGVVWVAYTFGSNWRAVNSTDGGATWGTPANVQTGVNNVQAYPGTGEITFTGGPPGTVWTDVRDQPTEGRNVLFSSTQDLFAPFVRFTYPDNGTTNVSTFADLTVVFSEPMNITATQPVWNITPYVNGTFAWPTRDVMRFTPTSPFKGSTRYVVSLNASAKDLAGNNLSPYQFEFTTGAGDSQPPAVNIIAPSNGSTVSGSVLINATASDNVGVTKVVFTVDSTDVANFTSPPYEYTWDSTSVQDGPHTITVTARDASGNSGNAGASITVKNWDTTPPTVTIVSPQDGAGVSGNVTIEVNATDDTSVSRVVIRVDANEVANLTAPPYTFNWDTATGSDGAHTINATASDPSGNLGYDEISVVVTNMDTVPPQVTFVRPDNGQRLSGTVTVEVDASDNLAVSHVVLEVDGSLLANMTSSPYTYDWDTSGVADGSHTLNATAYDPAGNHASVEITVNVQNLDRAPQIFHVPVETAVQGVAVHIAANVTDDTGVKVVMLNVTSGGVDVSIEMRSAGGGEGYEADIPGTLVEPPSIGYWIYAEDVSGHTNRTPASGTYKITVSRTEWLSFEMLVIIVAVIVAVIVVAVGVVVRRARKRKREKAAAQTSPFQMGPPPPAETGQSVQPPAGFAPEPPQQPPPGLAPQYPGGFTSEPSAPAPEVPVSETARPPPSPPKTEDDLGWGFPFEGREDQIAPADSTLICSSCLTSNPPGSQWCMNCGERLS